MTEPNTTTPKKTAASVAASKPAGEEWQIQISKKIAGDLWNFRARDAEAFAELSKGLAEHGDDILNSLGSFVQIVIARTVQTEEFNSSTSKPASKQPVSRQSDDGGTPSCKHGPMKDLADKNYKNRWYCSSTDRKNQCPSLP